MAAHQALPSLEFSRQEHWSGLPFPSPMHESEKWKCRVRLLATPWTSAYQASPSMGFSRQEYWSGVPLPSPYFPNKFIDFIAIHLTWSSPYVNTTVFSTYKIGSFNEKLKYIDQLLKKSKFYERVITKPVKLYINVILCKSNYILSYMSLCQQLL